MAVEWIVNCIKLIEKIWGGTDEKIEINIGLVWRL